MRRHLIALSLLILVSGVTLGAITGSKHDLSTTGPGTPATATDQKCVFCHTPHNSLSDVPLWNHQKSTGGTGYDYYTSATLDATGQDVLSATSGSSLCMSCHDNTVGVGTVFNQPQTGAITALGTIATLGTGIGNLSLDLTNDHPVGFQFNAALISTDQGSQATAQLQLPTNGLVELHGAGSDRLECATCHDPHDTTNAPFLVMSNANSLLCGQCHLK